VPHFDLSQARCADKSLILCSGRPKARPRLPGAPGAAQIESFDLRKRGSKFINLAVIDHVERVKTRYPLGARGLNTRDLRHAGIHEAVT
jgi:hypothetical protein